MRLIARAVAARPRSGHTLDQLSWLFTLFAIGSALVSIGALVAQPPAQAPIEVAGVAGAATLIGLWAYAQLREPFDRLDDVVAICCVAAVAVASVSAHALAPLIGVLLGAVTLSSLYVSTRRVAFQAALAPTVVVLLALAGEIDPATAGYLALAFPALAGVSHALPAFVRRYEEGARREHILAATGLSLVAASDIDSIVRSASEGACALCSSFGNARAWLALADRPSNAPQPTEGGPPTRLKVVSAAGDDAERHVGATFDVALLPGFDLALDGQRVVRVSPPEAERLAEAGLPVASPTLLLTAVTIGGEIRGLLGVENDGEIPGELASAIRSLVNEIALAISHSELQADALERRTSERFRALVQNSSDVILIVDPDLRTRYVSPSALPIFGHEAARLTGRRMSEVIHPDDIEDARAVFESCLLDPTSSPILECRIQHADGTWRFTETHLSNLLAEPAVGGVVLNTRDVTERHTLEDELRHQAFHDVLTGLANRALFVDRVQNAVERSRREGTTIAVLFIDLEGFRRVNDSLGYAAGDAALRACAERLRSCVRTPDTVARLGADEFAILLDGLTTPTDATIAAERIINVLRQPLTLRTASVELQPHIGIAVAFGGDETPDELLRNGAVAMHRAKTADGGYTMFDPEMHAAALRRLEVESELRDAIEGNQLVLHYQPTVDLHSGKLTGVEALVRWQHPVRGLVPPLEFIPLAEETGQIVTLGRWAMREACRQVRTWQQEFAGAPLNLSVNLSARQLRHPSLVRDVVDALDDAGLLPSRLTLELTESVLMMDTASTLNKLFQLKGIGVKLAIDDFGTGYSSFAYLRRFPIDILKIDKSFVDGVATEPTCGALVDAMIRIGKTLRMETVAEGVERPEQAEQLRALKCDIGQGYLFSRPLPSEDLSRFLLERQQPRAAGEEAPAA